MKWTSDCLKTILKSMEREKNSGRPTNKVIQDSLCEFRKENRIPTNVNILKWWKEQQNQRPELYDISKIILAASATQVSVERLFSAVKFIMSPRRNRLDDDSLNAVLILKTNKDLF